MINVKIYFKFKIFLLSQQSKYHPFVKQDKSETIQFNCSYEKYHVTTTAIIYQSWVHGKLSESLDQRAQLTQWGIQMMLDGIDDDKSMGEGVYTAIITLP